MNIYQFMSDSPWLTLFLAYLTAYTIWTLLELCVGSLNIVIRGYPPAHCDATGKFKANKDNKC